MIQQVITKTMETPIKIYLKEIDSLEVFGKEHRPMLEEGQIHILINGQDALKYTVDTSTGEVFMYVRDMEADDAYNAEALELRDELIKSERTKEDKEEKMEILNKKYPQKHHIIKVPVEFTYGDNVNIVDHPFISSYIR